MGSIYSDHGTDTAISWNHFHWYNSLVSSNAVFKNLEVFAYYKNINTYPKLGFFSQSFSHRQWSLLFIVDVYVREKCSKSIRFGHRIGFTTRNFYQLWIFFCYYKLFCYCIRNKLFSLGRDGLQIFSNWYNIALVPAWAECKVCNNYISKYSNAWFLKNVVKPKLLLWLKGRHQICWRNFRAWVCIWP